MLTGISNFIKHSRKLQKNPNLCCQVSALQLNYYNYVVPYTWANTNKSSGMLSWAVRP